MKNFTVRFTDLVGFPPEPRTRYLTPKRLGCSVMTTNVAKVQRLDRAKAHEFAGRFNSFNAGTGVTAEAIKIGDAK